jgi:hypothetical protein
MTEPLELFTIYDRPADFPHSVVCRRFRVFSGRLEADPLPCVIGHDLIFVREALRLEHPGLVCIGREPGDEPSVVETWL